MRIYLLLFIIGSLALSGCKKPDPHPELKDPIFLDLQRELGEAQKAVDAEKANLEEHKKNLQSAVPQTGQIKYAQKRYNDSVALISKLQQMVKYWEVRLDTRQSDARKQYLEAYNKEKPWPDPKEWEEYQSIQKMQHIQKTWSVQNRINELGLNKKPKPASSEHGGGGEHSEPPAEAHH